MANDGPDTVEDKLPVNLGDPFLFGNTINEFASVKLIATGKPRMVANGRRLWHSQANYSTIASEECTTNDIDPLEQPPTVRFSSQKFQGVVHLGTNVTDGGGGGSGQHTDAIVNSAGEKFDPPLMRDASRLQITIDANEPTFEPLLADRYHGAINSDSVQIKGVTYPKHTLKIDSVTAVEKFQSNCQGSYWAVQIVILANRDTWVRRIVDSGFNQLVDDKVKRIVDDDSIPFDTQQLLDGNGVWVRPGPNAQPTILKYLVDHSLPFAALNLPI